MFIDWEMRVWTPKMSSPTPKYQMGDYIDDNYEVHAAPPAPAPAPVPKQKAR